MADIGAKKDNPELVAKRAEQRSAELRFAIARLEVKKLEMQAELLSLDESLAATQKALSDHIANSQNLS